MVIKAALKRQSVGSHSERSAPKRPKTSADRAVSSDLASAACSLRRPFHALYSLWRSFSCRADLRRPFYFGLPSPSALFLLCIPSLQKGLTSTAVKKGGLYAADIATQYKYKNTIVDLKLDAESNISSTVTVSEILPSTKAIASLKFPDYSSGKLEVQYFHDHASVSSAVGLNQSPIIDVSAAIGAHGVVFGAEAGFDTTSKSFTKYNAGISLTQPTYIASVVLENKGDVLRASYLQHLDGNRLTAVKEFVRKFSSNENIITVGGSCALDPLTSVKVKLTNDWKLGALLQHELRPKSVLTISTEVDTKALHQHPKFGLALALKP